jgi:hypothetical protein
MSDPSITSGESIILTTHGVSFNGILYNMILTTRRLILVDGGDTMSQPRTIPLVLLQSATAADGFGGEPLLILTLGGMAGTGESGAVNLFFPQHFGEDRRRERNEWIKKLNKHTAYARGQTVFSKLCAVRGNAIRFFGAARSRDDGSSAGSLPGTAPQVPVPAGSADTGTPASRAGGPEGMPPAGEMTPPIAGSPPSPAPRRVGQHTMVTVALILIFIVGMAAGAFLYSEYLTAGTGDTRAPLVAPESAVWQAPAPTPAIIPTEGTWVRVEYNGTFVGWVGTPGSLRHVGGSGEQIYPIRNDTKYVQGSFQKQDYSGKTLTVEVYFRGVMTYQRTVRSPMGEIAFLIDPRTAEIPGVTPAAAYPGK